MNCRIQEIVDKNEKETIARDILNGLPEWFGMPDLYKIYRGQINVTCGQERCIEVIPL